MTSYADLSGNVELIASNSMPSFQQSRGFYFSGNSAFMINSQMVLSPDNIIIFWFNPDQSSEKRVLLDKQFKLTIILL